MILSEEQIMIRDMARDFADNELTPHAAEWDRNATLPIEVLHQMGSLGLMGMTIPEEWGGLGLGKIAINYGYYRFSC